MSTYYKPTKHPHNGLFYKALHIDDHFGSHQYGIKFPDGLIVPEKSYEDMHTMQMVFEPETCDHDLRKTIEDWSKIDGLVVLDPDGFDRKDPYLYQRAFTREEWDKALATSTVEKKPLMVVETHPDGKETVITKHDDGRQDVKINVTRLDIKNPTPEDKIAEQAIIDKLQNTRVGVLLIERHTDHNIYFTCSLPNVRSNVEMAIQKYAEQHQDRHVDKKDFIIVESAVVTDKPKVTTL